IGEDVAARAMPSDAPLDLESAPLDAAGTAHQPVHVWQLVSHVIERGSVVAEDRHAVVIGAAPQELHHMRAVRDLEAEHGDEEGDLSVGARAVEDDVADLGRPRAIEDHALMLHEIRGYAHWQPVGSAKAKAVAAAGAVIERPRVALDVHSIASRLRA